MDDRVRSNDDLSIDEVMGNAPHHKEFDATLAPPLDPIVDRQQPALPPRPEKPAPRLRGKKKQQYERMIRETTLAATGIRPSILAHRQSQTTRRKAANRSSNLLPMILLSFVAVLSVWGLSTLRDDIDEVDEQNLAAVQFQTQSAELLSTTLAALQADTHAQSTSVAATLSMISSQQNTGPSPVVTMLDGLAGTEMALDGALGTISPTPTLTLTPTSTYTNSPTFTVTPSTTPSNTPTSSPTPAPPSPTSTPIIFSSNQGAINIREFPGSGFLIINTLNNGECFEILARYTNQNEATYKEWLEITTSADPSCTNPSSKPGVKGWVARDLLIGLPENLDIPLSQINPPTP